MRWRPALNAFAITFADRWPAARNLLMETAGNTVSETDPADAGGVPAYGNQRSEWDAGARFDFENPEYR
jgi:hypothetical protein